MTKEQNLYCTSNNPVDHTIVTHTQAPASLQRLTQWFAKDLGMQSQFVLNGFLDPFAIRFWKLRKSPKVNLRAVPDDVGHNTFDQKVL